MNKKAAILKIFKENGKIYLPKAYCTLIEDNKIIMKTYIEGNERYISFNDFVNEYGNDVLPSIQNDKEVNIASKILEK